MQVARDVLSADRDFYRRLLALSDRDDLEPLLDDALATLVDIVGAHIAYLQLHAEDSEEPRYWRAHGLSDSDVGRVRASISRGIIAQTIAGGSSVETPSALDDARFADLASVQENAIQSVLCMPIGARPPVGVLYVQGPARPSGFSAEDRERLALFARQLAPLADRLLATRPTRATVDHTREVRRRFACPQMVGRSEALAHVLQQASLVAPLEVDVLITGPSGTGKTLLARAIAANSRRPTGAFVALNCAALPEPLLESELFGAERGAHSTATRRVLGKVAAAEGGTLFLDEIGDLPLSAQAKLLHLLQDREYHPLGATTPVRADVRMIFATNADLKRRVTERTFREDLYYRLNVLPIAMPGLDERRDDIPEIITHLVTAACRRHGFGVMHAARRTLLAAQEAPWPGNVRELAHAVEAAVIRAHGARESMVREHHLFSDRPASNDDTPATYHEATRRFQRRYVQEALERNDWNVAEAARQLGLARSYVYTLIDSLGLGRTAT